MKYFSMFSGIGGFELGIKQANDECLHKVSEDGYCHRCFEQRLNPPECVGFSEIDKYAISIYQKHFPNHKLYGNCTTIEPVSLPDFDLLVGGFPCQSFSIAGKRGGFEDTRGTLFFEIARIARVKRPRYLLLENVKGLLSHDEGNTFATIIGALDELGYDVQWQVLNSKNFGVPQNRERVFIVGHLRGTSRPQVFPFGENNTGLSKQEKHLHGKTTTERQESDCLNGDFPLRKDGDNRQLHQIIGGGQGERVYDPKGLATTIASQAGGLGAKTGLYMIDDPSRKVGIVDKNVAPTLRSETHGNLPVIIQKIGNNKESEDYVERKLVGALKSSNQANPRSGGTSLVAIDPYNNKEIDPKNATTLRTNHQNGNTWVARDLKIRRLTPTECERLQGFPDGWTKVGAPSTPISDTQRYKCLGNAVTVNVIQAIINKLLYGIS